MNVRIRGNIAGYENGRHEELRVPIKITPSREYLDRKNKYDKWLEYREERNKGGDQ